MSLISGALKMLDSFNPVSKLLDVAGDALGLPPEMKNVLKIGGGFLTGNVVMIASGAMNAAEDAARHRPATTEYPAGSGGGIGAGPSGYAPPASGNSHGAGRQGGTLDPSILEYRDSLRTLSAGFEVFDALDGSNNDKFDLRTLSKVANEPRMSADLRKAASFLLAHPEYRNQLDTAHKGGRVDGTISRKDVDQALRNVDKAIAQHGVREPAHCAPPAPSGPVPPPCGTPAPGTPVPSTPAPPTGTPSVPGNSGSPLDPELRDYLSALKTVEANFATLDGAAGVHNGQITLADLRGMANDARLSPELRQAARFLVSNPGYFERLDAASPGTRPLPHAPLHPTIPGHAPTGANDDTFDLQAVRAERSRVEADLKTYGSPARPGTGSGGSSPATRSSGDVASILNDPSMSIEEKIELVLSGLMDNSDAEIVATMDELAAAQNKSAGIKECPGADKARQESQTSVEKLNLKLQKLMEKRKAMFELMSNMSTKFNEMAKAAISNLGRA
jgi:hypothetical protein